MRKRPRRQSAKRTIIILATAVALLTVLVLAARSYRAAPLIEPETPEMLAKRLAPDNAYHALLALADDLPDRPTRSGPFSLGVLRRRGALLALELGIRRPDDDPEVVQYIEATRPIAAAVAAVLEEQSYLCAPIDSLDANTEALDAFHNLARILGGHALHAAQRGDAEDAMRFSLAGLKLGKAVASDGPLENFLKGSSMIDQCAIWAMCLPWDRYAEEELRAFLRALDALDPADLDICAAFDWELRLIEAGAYASSESAQRSGLRERLKDAALRRFARKGIDNVREAAQLSHAELQTWSSQHQRLRGVEHELLPTRLISGVENAVIARTNTATHADALRALVALDLYHKTHGVYPETLDALTPEFLDTVPIDAYAAAPLRYSPKNGSYTMYSIGPSGQDDGGDPKNDYLFPPPLAEPFQATLEDPDTDT